MPKVVPLAGLDERRIAPPARLQPSEGLGQASVTHLWGFCPWSEELSDYDRAHIPIYAQLLYDESEGATEEDLARGIFRLDPFSNRARVQRIVRSHLRRAHWIADALFPFLGW